MLVRPALGGLAPKLFLPLMPQSLMNVAVGIASAARFGRSVNITTDGLTFLRVSVLPSNVTFCAVWMNSQLASLPAALAVSAGSAQAGLDNKAIASNAAPACFANVMSVIRPSYAASFIRGAVSTPSEGT